MDCSLDRHFYMTYFFSVNRISLHSFFLQFSGNKEIDTSLFNLCRKTSDNFNTCGWAWWWFTKTSSFPYGFSSSSPPFCSYSPFWCQNLSSFEMTFRRIESSCSWYWEHMPALWWYDGLFAAQWGHYTQCYLH